MEIAENYIKLCTYFTQFRKRLHHPISQSPPPLVDVLQSSDGIRQPAIGSDEAKLRAADRKAAAAAFGHNHHHSSQSQADTDRGSMSDQAFACSASSVESIPSASGSSECSVVRCVVCVTWSHVTMSPTTGTQALVRPGSPHSSISAEERPPFAPVICLAKALVDSLPNPYDKEALRFKVRVESADGLVVSL